jgi:hypothetical protein
VLAVAQIATLFATLSLDFARSRRSCAVIAVFDNGFLWLVSALNGALTI